MMMTNSTREFFRDDPWELIEKPCYPEGRRLYLNDERFWVSMDENLQILFFVQDVGAETLQPLENLSGINVAVEKFGDGACRLVCRLTSQEAGLKEKFSIVAKDIAYYCSSYSGTQLFFKTQERIKSWANFLKPSHSGLSHSEFVGYFGELYVFAEHILPVLTASEAVSAWIGLDGKKQDFTFNSSAIEVKTTLAGDPQTICISSLDQLEKITNRLYLMQVIASPSGDGKGTSLGELYQKCLELVGHDVIAEGLFLQKASRHYGKASESQIKDRFLILRISFFDVKDGFPALTHRNVESAIREAKYEIAVSAIKEYEVATDVGEIISDG